MMLYLLFHYFIQMSNHATSLYPVLFETLSDFSDEVVVQGLTVLAEIVNSTSTKGMHAFSKNIV